MAFPLHRHIPLVRRPFWQRDLARSELATCRAELASALRECNTARAERDAMLACPLRRHPWYGVDEPTNVPTGRGMVHPDERRLLYVLARDYFSGAGRIIDGGAYLGSSSLALGLGLQDRNYPREPVIDAFDTFVIDAFSVEHHVDPSKDTVKAGDSVRHIYDRNVQQVSPYITVHEGDVTASPWTGAPIEILFCDISKGWSLNDYILMNWMPSLIPGRSILVQQDQVQEHHVWVAITMEMLADYFETIDFTPHSSMVYRPTREIPRSALERCLSANISASDMEHCYLRFRDRFSRVGMGRYRGWHLGMVEVGLIVTYGFHIGDRERAFHHLRRCEETFSGVPDTMARLAAIRRHLEAGTPCPGSRLFW